MAEIKFTKDNFEQEVIQSDRTVLVDFWASWCGPCRMVSPIIEELANELAPDIKVGKVNVDEQPELAEEFQVMTIPTLMVIKDKKIVASSVGAKTKKEILKMLEA